MAKKKKNSHPVKFNKAGEKQFKGVNPVEGPTPPRERDKVKEPEIEETDQETDQETNSFRIEGVPEGKLKRVKCLIFQAKNETIKRITQAINEEEQVSQKAMLAQKLLDEVEALLQCEYFNEKRAECRACQTISETRKATAELILKVGEIKMTTK